MKKIRLAGRPGVRRICCEKGFTIETDETFNEPTNSSFGEYVMLTWSQIQEINNSLLPYEERIGIDDIGIEERRVCTVCEEISPPKKQYSGSTLLEFLLWLMAILLFLSPFSFFFSEIFLFMFFIPALLYSIWRHSPKKDFCPHCKSQNIVPFDSPVGKRIRATRKK